MRASKTTRLLLVFRPKEKRQQNHEIIPVAITDVSKSGGGTKPLPVAAGYESSGLSDINLT